MKTPRLPEISYETFVVALITVGLPLVALLYLDWRAAVTTFVVVNILLGVMVVRGSK